MHAPDELAIAGIHRHHADRSITVDEDPGWIPVAPNQASVFSLPAAALLAEDKPTAG